MPEGEYEFFSREELLSFEEIAKFVKAVIPLGVKSVFIIMYEGGVDDKQRAP